MNKLKPFIIIYSTDDLGISLCDIPVVIFLSSRRYDWCGFASCVKYHVYAVAAGNQSPKA